ncbi:MAG: flippase-like domain-containing protein [Deltaproteobacteria bacterium]|nr:flippase-like domain-containing protein [Deltaproteobacteria bacterium]
MIRGARVAHAAIVLAGFGVFAALVQHVGPARLVDDLRRFGWAILAVVAFELVIDACNTAAWRAILPPGSPVGFGRLYWVRQAGVAINQVTPTATVGGEVVKTLLLRPYLRTATTAASLVAARMSYALGQTILVLLGLSAVLSRTGDAPDLRGAIVLTVVATAGGVLSFVWLQRGGIFARLANGLPRLGLAERLVERARAAARALDRQLAAFYRERPGAFVASVSWHALGQIVGLFQLSFTLTMLGMPVSIATCLAIEAFALVLDSAAFLVPGRVGVQEAGRVLVFTTFGLSATTGLAVAVIVRLSQLTVVALGLAAYAVLSMRAPAPDRA